MFSETGHGEPREISEVEKLQGLFEKQKISSRLVEFPGGTEYRQALIFSRDGQKSAEPLVRVYRGISQLDETLFQQVSYALRTHEGKEKGVVLLDHARAEVRALTKNPTHENLLHYLETVWPDVSDEEVERLEEELTTIEDDVLNGLSLRKSLVHKTFAHTGGTYTDTGVAPYISASSDAEQAAAYATKGIMVLDLPISKIEALTGGTAREVAIKGEIEKEFIAAILLKEPLFGSDEAENHDPELQRALEKVSQEISEKVLDDNESNEQFSILKKQEEEFDRLHREQDVWSIIESRTKKVLSKFPDARPSAEDISRLESTEQVDKYTATKRAIYDIFAKRLAAAGIKKERLEDYYIFESSVVPGAFYSKDVYFSRSAVTDKMLLKLREVVLRQEKYQAARK